MLGVALDGNDIDRVGPSRLQLVGMHVDRKAEVRIKQRHLLPGVAGIVGGITSQCVGERDVGDAALDRNAMDAGRPA